MPFKPHPTDPDKVVLVSRKYDLPDKGEEHMKNLTQNELVGGLTLELFDVLMKYEDSMLLATTVGVLEILKNDLLKNGYKQTVQLMVEKKERDEE